MSSKTKLTVMDVLSIAVQLSGGENTLPKKVSKHNYNYKEIQQKRNSNKFNLDEFQKTMILSLFEKSDLDLSIMNQGRKYGRFIRLGELIKPNLHSFDYPKTYLCFKHLRNQKRKGKPYGYPKI